MATPSSGTITMFDINSAFNRGNNLNAYRGTVWYQPNSTVTGTFPAGQIAFSDFYNKTGTDPVVPSPIDGVPYTTPGTYNFVVPFFRTSLTAQVYGAGGGGGGYAGYGNAGGYSSFSSVIAYGGGGGGGASSNVGGAGGTATGGTTNVSGGAGSTYGGAGGNSGGGAVGGAGGTTYLFNFGRLNDNQVWGGSNGANYGAGGGATQIYGGKFRQDGGAGGGGAYAVRSYTPSQLTVGSTIQIVVGLRGTGADSQYNANVGYGGIGAVIVKWT